MAKPVNVSGTSATIAVEQVGDIADATPIDMSRSDAIGLAIATGTSLGTVTVYACLTVDGTYLILKDNETGQDVTFTATAARAMMVPVPAQGWPRFIKLICSGTATTVVAEGKRIARF